ncbi:MAG: ADOP family duplicated permease [Vicinamibacterales bacterium]
MSHFLTDLAQSWRLMRRQPGLAFAALVALAMGIGFTTTMFSIVHGGTRGLPFDQPDEIVVLQETDHGRASNGPSVRPYTFLRWREALTSFDGLAAFRPDSVNVSGGATPERVPAAAVTPDTFALLGVAAARGRVIGPADAAPGAPAVALIGDALWRSRYGADPSAVGGTIRINGVPHTIVGVMPAGFGFPIHARLWTPLRVDPAAAPGDGDVLQVFGRLRDGMTADRAAREASLEMRRLAAGLPDAYDGHDAAVIGFTEMETPRELARGLYVLVVAVSLAFLVACANVANLLLARAAARSRDTALRSALGASRGRLIGQQLAETLLLAGLACVLGLVMASAGLRFFAQASSGILEAFWVDFRIDAGVVAFATALGLLSALAAGLVPALRATSARSNLLVHLKGDGTGATGLRIGRLGRALVVVQLALACGLLVLTATFVRASAVIHAADLVFPAKQILTADLGIPAGTISDPAPRARLLADLRDTLAATPGVGPTAFVSALPGRGAGQWSLSFTDQPDDPSRYTGVVMVTPEFFDLAGASPTRGRLLTWRDDGRAALVAVVNESFVRRFSSDREVLGRQVVIGERPFTIAGVVRDLRMQDPEDQDGSGIYLSMLQARPFAVRTMTLAGGAPLDAVPALRAAVARVDPDLPVVQPASLYDAIYADKQVLDAVAALFLAFGCGTVFLALVGLFALLSFTVTSRTREFGVRLALGATGRDLVAIVIRRGAGELAWGLGIGLVLAFAISRMLGAVLENVPPAGPSVFLAIVATVGAGAALALWRPLRRATALSATTALRE